MHMNIHSTFDLKMNSKGSNIMEDYYFGMNSNV